MHFRHLTNQELLRFLSEKRMYSSLIEELCIRIENIEYKSETNESKEDILTCPICYSKLKVALDEEILTIKPSLNKVT